MVSMIVSTTEEVSENMPRMKTFTCAGQSREHEPNPPAGATTAAVHVLQEEEAEGGIRWKRKEIAAELGGAGPQLR